MRMKLFTTVAAALLTVGASASQADIPAGYEPTGETRSCLPLRSIDSIDAIDEETFLVETRSGLYISHANGSCNRADSNFTYIEYRTSQSSLCSNDIIDIVDRGTNIPAGSCSLGEFEELAEVEEEAVED